MNSENYLINKEGLNRNELLTKIKSIGNLNKASNLILNTIKKELRIMGKTKVPQVYVIALVETLSEILMQNENLNYEEIQLKINGCNQLIKNIKINKKSKIENIDLRSLLKETEKKLKDINTFIRFYHEDVTKNKDYLLLAELVYNIKDIGLLYDVLKYDKKILLSKNYNNEFFYEELVGNFLEICRIPNQKNMLDIIYYEMIIDTFLTNYRSNFEKINIKLVNDISYNIELIKRSEGYKRDKDKRITALENLRNNIKNIDINPNRKIEYLNSKYNKNGDCHNKFIFTVNNEYPRVDLTGLYTITIDPENCCSLDQALSIEKLENGHTVLYVHLTDASSYIEKDSILDKEALNKAYTLYLPNKDIITMLPEILCFEKCSLTKDIDKVAVSYNIELDEKYNIVCSSRMNSLIRVDENFSFDYVNKILNSEDESTEFMFFKELENISNGFDKTFEFNKTKNKYYEIYDSLYNNFSKEKEEIRSQNIMTNMMLKVGELEARHASINGIPFLYRGHDKVDLNKVIPETENLKKMLLEKNIPEVEVHKMIKKSLLSRYGTAYYSRESKGHFGLGMEHYARITCPMGNYSSLINQRITKDITMQKHVENKVVYYYEDKLPEIAEELNKNQEINEIYIDEYYKIKNKR